MKKRLLILLTIFMVIFTSCEQDIKDDAKLPENATNIISKGNNWYTFELDGNEYLYHKSYRCYSGFECITQIK